MKPNLKDFPKEMLEGIDYSPTAKKLLAWFEAFKHKLEEIGPVYDKWLDELEKKDPDIFSDPVKALELFVKQEILGDSEVG